MAWLPNMVYADGIRKQTQIKFGGYDHRIGAEDGSVWDEKNMSSRVYPVMEPRKPRYTVRQLTTPNGYYIHDGVHYWADGTELFKDGKKIGNVKNSKKVFASLGKYIAIWPDKQVYHTEEETLEPVESTWTGAAKIQNGTYLDVESAANTIKAPGVDFADYFRAGDAVTISGATVHEKNNTTIIIREVDGDELRFYENSFVIGENGDSEAALTIKREAPEMDFLCENENRLWGCKGDTIFSSKLGDPFNWNCFDGLATDSYAVDVGSEGDFTGAVSYLGYAVFFKPEKIYKVYGSQPSNYQVMGSAALGVDIGSGKSLAVAGETLFYLSRAGVMAYTGGLPQSAAEAFGTEQYQNGVAGSDGIRYWISMENKKGDLSLFCFDTQNGVWTREDETKALDFGWDRGVYMLRSDGTVLLLGDAMEIPEDATQEAQVGSFVEFGDFTHEDPNRKGVSKFQLRVEVEQGATLELLVQFDSDGVWRSVKTMKPDKKKSYYLAVVPRRCDHYRIKLVGTGMWRLYSMTRESYSGSEL